VLNLSGIIDSKIDEIIHFFFKKSKQGREQIFNFAKYQISSLKFVLDTSDVRKQ